MSIFLGPMIGLVIANFLYQAFGLQDWSLALERSWFQVIAIVAVWMMAAIRSFAEQR